VFLENRAGLVWIKSCGVVTEFGFMLYRADDRVGR